MLSHHEKTRNLLLSSSQKVKQKTNEKRRLIEISKPKQWIIQMVAGIVGNAFWLPWFCSFQTIIVRNM